MDNPSGQKIDKFLRYNGICWHNVKLFPKTFVSCIADVTIFCVIGQCVAKIFGGVKE